MTSQKGQPHFKNLAARYVYVYMSSRVFSSTTLRTNPLSHMTFTLQTEVIHEAPCKAEVTNGVTNEVTISAQPKLKIFQNLPLHPVQCFLHL